jgi:hypothetical protein
LLPQGRYRTLDGQDHGAFWTAPDAVAGPSPSYSTLNRGGRCLRAPGRELAGHVVEDLADADDLERQPNLEAQAGIGGEGAE